MFAIEQAKRYLRNANVLYYDPDDHDDEEEMQNTINLNDAYWWGTAYCQKVSDLEMPEVARLCWSYGWCGVLYWCWLKMDKASIEFKDVRRFVQFVVNEENIRNQFPDTNQRAYKDAEYIITGAL